MTQVQLNNGYTQAQATQALLGRHAAQAWQGEPIDQTNGWHWCEGFILTLLQAKGPLAVRLALRNWPEASRG